MMDGTEMNDEDGYNRIDFPSLAWSEVAAAVTKDIPHSVMRRLAWQRHKNKAT